MDQKTLQEQNARLAGMLREARDQITMLKLEVDRLSQPPSGFGLVLAAHSAAEVDVWAGGRKLRAGIHQPLGATWLDAGQEVALNGDLNAVSLGNYSGTGEVVTLLDVLPDGRRAVVAPANGRDRVVILAGPVWRANPYPGDKLLMYPNSDVAVEIVPTSVVDAYMAESSPTVAYSDLVGLTGPAVKPADFTAALGRDPGELAEVGLTPSKGILLYRPDGCGKTALARAFANSLGMPGERPEWAGRAVPAILLEVKYPNMLDKYAGELERRIRVVFKRAREMARRGIPVVAFFPRIDVLPAVFNAAKAAGDINLSVPLVAAEIDSLQQLDGPVAVVATSRRQAIESALLGPGPLEVRIAVERPGQAEAREILAWYLTVGPRSSVMQAGALRYQIDDLIEQVIELIYAESPAISQVEVTAEDSRRKVIRFPDLISRALLHDIASQAKCRALMRHPAGRDLHVQVPDLIAAARAAMEQTMQLAASSRRYDWGWLHESAAFDVVSARRLPAETI